MWSEGGEETECAVRILKSTGKVQNIKGNALVADFVHLFIQFCMFASPILITGGDELSKCSLKYEPSVFNINTNVKDGITHELSRFVSNQ